MSRGSLFTIAPHAPFLDTLVEAIVEGRLLAEWPREGPFWLSDITIILPTLRARRALADALLARLGPAILLPDIRVFGGEAEDEEPFLPPFDAPPLPRAIGPIKRRLILAQMVETWIARRPDRPFSAQGVDRAHPPNAAEILALADSLGHLIDDLHVEMVPPTNLADIAPGDLAENWQQTLTFLDIALTAWPEVLEGEDETDAAHLRNIRLERQAAAAPLIFGERPVIAAGSTGSIPATAQLLRAIAALPRGIVVLPGLDTTLTPTAHEALLDDALSPHGHPQYGLAKLIRGFATTPAAVDDLAPDADHPRTALVRRALALAESTADWAPERAAFGDARLAAATAGVSVFAARTEEEEARAIALAGTHALAGGESVGIIAQDRNLARRIVAELARYDVMVDDSAGTPLFQSRIGRFARTALALAASDFGAVDLMALLRNRETTLGLSRAEVVQRADLIEFGLLRGQRLMPGLAGLRHALAENLADRKPRMRKLTEDDGVAVTDLLARLEDALTPLTTVLGHTAIRAAGLADALGTAVDALAAPAEGVKQDDPPGRREFADWVAATALETGRGPVLARAGIDGALAGLMTGISVRAQRSARTDIAIWGRIEARLQNRDLTILAGLNEGIWPEVADPGPWMSRNMRMTAGLEPPERDQGRAAHDFELAMGNARVILAYAERVGASPSTPSRLLQRLEAFAGEDISAQMRTRGAYWIEGARRLDDPGQTATPASRPAPRPPAHIRPRRLSFTEVETLFCSPYDLYARHVLGLRALDPLGAEPDLRERGTLIHKVFGDFVAEGHDPLAPDAHDTLMTLAARAFAGLDAIEQRREIWLRRFSAAAHGFLAFERARAANVAERHPEVRGRWAFEVAGEEFTLHGRADRVDVLADGRLELIDFKTGGIPSPADMKAYLAPQLLAEAALARNGGFEGVAGAAAGALTYIKIGAGPEAFEIKPFQAAPGAGLDAAADELMRRVHRHAEAFLLRDDLAMVPRLFPAPGQRFAGDYDHLARTGEWSMTDGEDGE